MKCRSPRQLWNALLLGTKVDPDTRQIVAVPVNYGMLSYYKKKLWFVRLPVAVPVNYGMLSYRHQVRVHTE